MNYQDLNNDEYLRPTFSNRAQSDRSVNIERIVIRVLPPSPVLFRRPNQVTGFNGFNQNFVADRVIDALHANGYRGHIPKTSFSGVSGGFLRPSNSPTGLIDSPDESYAVIWIWVRTKSHAVDSEKYELLCGRLDARALQFDFNNECVGIEPEAEIRINNMVLLDVQHQHSNRDTRRATTQERLRFNYNSDFVASDSYRNINDDNMLIDQTPSTAFYHHLGSMSNLFDTSNQSIDMLVPSAAIVKGRGRAIEQNNANPSNFIAKVTNTIIEGENASDLEMLNVRTDDEYYDQELADRNGRLSRCATISDTNVFNKRFAFNDAINRLSAAMSEGSNSGLYGGYVSWEDICKIAPRFTDFTSKDAYRDVDVHLSKGMLVNRGIAANQRFNNTHSEWSATSNEASMAHMLSHMVLATMGELGISSIYFHVTNETISGNWESHIKGDSSLSYVYGNGNVNTINNFLTRVELEIMPDVASSGDGYSHEIYAEVYADVLGSVEIVLRVDNGDEQNFTLPSTMTCETTPSLTNNYNTLKSISNTVGSLVDEISHRRQHESVEVLRSNTLGTRHPADPTGRRPTIR